MLRPARGRRAACSRSRFGRCAGAVVGGARAVVGGLRVSQVLDAPRRRPSSVRRTAHSGAGGRLPPLRFFHHVGASTSSAPRALPGPGGLERVLRRQLRLRLCGIACTRGVRGQAAPQPASSGRLFPGAARAQIAPHSVPC